MPQGQLTLSLSQSFLIALGANEPSQVGFPLVTLNAALARLKAYDVWVRSVSPYYATPAFPAGIGPNFVNAAAIIDTSLGAEALLAVLHTVEGLFGRTRQTRWGQRTLDIDLLAQGDQVLPDRATYKSWADLPVEAQSQRSPKEMILPHPRIQDRAFVLVPLADVAPDWLHPVLGKTVAQMLADLPPEEVRSVTPV